MLDSLEADIEGWAAEARASMSDEPDRQKRAFDSALVFAYTRVLGQLRLARLSDA